MTLTSFSQATTKEVKVTTLIKIIKQIEKCDSLKVAYDNKSVLLDQLVADNLLVFDKLESERVKRVKAQEEVDKLNKQILKESKKCGNNRFLYGISGIIVGMIAVLSIN